MRKRFAVKRLTASDLTLFRWHFEHKNAGNQKAINLDSRILVNELFPRLGELTLPPHTRFLLELVLHGPGSAPPYSLQRKILKQQKNWRLNGEFIENPIDEPGRFDILAPGDFALFEFEGEEAPTRIRMHLVAQIHPGDAGLFSSLNSRFGIGSTWLIEQDELVDVLEAAQISSDHPLRDWLEGATAEDAAQGGAESIRRVNQRRGMSPEELLRARNAVEKIGLVGEVLVNDYLDNELSLGAIADFEWTSNLNAIAPFDFKLVNADGSVRFVDAKATSGQFSRPLHMSLGEIEWAVNQAAEYCIFRVYEVEDGTARMRVSRGLKEVLRPVLDAANSMPNGVVIDSVSIKPEVLPFESEELVLKQSVI